MQLRPAYGAGNVLVLVIRVRVKNCPENSPGMWCVVAWAQFIAKLAEFT